MSDPNDDPLSAFRGIFFGAAIGLVFWVFIVLLLCAALTGCVSFPSGCNFRHGTAAQAQECFH
jgi:hypothetical protein